MSISPPAPVVHPALLTHAQERAQNAQDRIADQITAFAGSMNFVYLHVILFATWMLVFEKSPWPTLTLIVSLEAIFLSTFVMISQNRQDDARRHLADMEWKTVQAEEGQNQQLIDLSNQILTLTRAIDELTRAHVASSTTTPPATPS